VRDPLTAALRPDDAVLPVRLDPEPPDTRDDDPPGRAELPLEPPEGGDVRVALPVVDDPAGRGRA
jgi:hypothetical protein